MENTGAQSIEYTLPAAVIAIAVSLFSLSAFVGFHPRGSPR
jgi:hypothetical protein